MDWTDTKNYIKSFVLHIPMTLKETCIWFLISYIIPLVNIGILWAMQREDFYLSLTILSIIIVTNACFLTALIYQSSIAVKKRQFINTVAIITLIVTVVLFAISVIDIEKEEKIFKLDIYKYGAFITLFISIILGLMSKYDEVKAESKDRARKAKETTSAMIRDKKYRL